MHIYTPKYMRILINPKHPEGGIGCWWVNLYRLKKYGYPPAGKHSYMVV